MIDTAQVGCCIQMGTGCLRIVDSAAIIEFFITTATAMLTNRFPFRAAGLRFSILFFHDARLAACAGKGQSAKTGKKRRKIVDSKSEIRY